ncbi:two-component system, OmpR family, phosphate regulon sensor histidine kinase PhoR [Marinobacter sp. DSM 26671]|jgi:two-component system phosphate regulon sensor histidine kinase PhoR|nr:MULTISPECIES: phosphate regulon sensor histidine kinase PhoR [unclassified Marinobacter]AKV95979.1 histidine kinase [Marinobacter sp. CP1]SFE12208.1 two-component system, OmpR family, phosphate regulon sensor histidine kinase PhoR [Marinobacter sp. DSM 26671]
MQHNWSRYLRYIIGGLIGSTLVGLYFGEPVYGLTFGLVVYLWWTLVQARRLYQWLSNPSATDEAPQSIGLWGDIFDNLHKLHQTHLRTQDRLRAQINRVQESTNAMRDGVIMTDSRGAMEWWNGSAEYLLGFRRNTDQGQYIHNLIRTPAFKTYFDSRDYREPLEIHSPARPHIHLQIQISLFGDDDRLIVAKDVTRLYQLEQMRRDFVGNVSHEMRTPLTVISGYLETLVDNAADLPPKWRRAINTMAAQSSRMEALITDLILLSRIETGEQTVNDTLTDVDQLLTQICHDARALSGEKQHEITVHIGDHRLLKGDESQLRSAFSNLIFNAVKYTPANGQIIVSWSTNREGAHLSVRDTGIGIDPVHIPRLTERFYRADPSRHKDTGGTGLGLAIVKHVLLNHDGNLEIRSRIGEGSEFICHFPRERLVERIPEKAES